MQHIQLESGVTATVQNPKIELSMNTDCRAIHSNFYFASISIRKNEIHVMESLEMSNYPQLDAFLIKSLIWISCAFKNVNPSRIQPNYPFEQNRKL